MNFSDGCIRLAESSWKLNVGYPVVFAYRLGELEDIVLPEDVKNIEDLEDFIQNLAVSDTFDAIAIISEVWFDMVTFGKPLKLDSKHFETQDGLAITIIGRERSFITLAPIKNGNLATFTPWKVLLGGRFANIRIGKKMEEAV